VTLMWEVRAVPGRLDELVAFVITHADPSAQIYRADGTDPRVVVIDPTEHGLPELPEGLAARPPHVWTFEPVAR
jgi:hypothetical protein